jgi:methionyl aminopeptidase
MVRNHARIGELMTITTAEQLRALQHANRMTTQLLREIEEMAKPGMTTRELDDYARAYIAKLGGEPVFETQAGFPGAINANPNDIVVHGIPGDYVLQDGDILTIDTGMLLGGVAGDAATTFVVGTSTPRHERLMATTRAAMDDAIKAAKTGKRVGDVSWAMQSRAERDGYSVARGFCGHGLGTRMWEKPDVPFAGRPGTGPVLKEGMVITIEPVVIEGTHQYYMANQWEARTIDGSWVAQYERAIMVTRDGGVVLSGD